MESSLCISWSCAWARTWIWLSEAPSAPGRGHPKSQGEGWQVSGAARLHGLCFQMCVQVRSLHGELINCWPSWKGCIFFLNSVILNKTLPFPFKGDIWAQRGRQGRGWRAGMGAGRGTCRKNTVPAWDPRGSSPCARLGPGPGHAHPPGSARGLGRTGDRWPRIPDLLQGGEIWLPSDFQERTPWR